MLMPEKENHILKITNISKSFAKRKVVDTVSLEFNNGAIFGILGPNGSGKTTCFYLIIGLISLDSGNIFLNDLPIENIAIDTRAKLGISYLPQEPSIFRHLSVQDNIMAILELNTHLNTLERTSKMHELLEKFSLSHIKNSLGVMLSGGERRRVEIARTLATNPKFIFLDEPFAGVDPISIAEIKGIIKLIANSGIGVIITDHNVRETLDVCEKAYILNAGKIIATGKPDEILQNPSVRKVYLGDQFIM